MVKPRSERRKKGEVVATRVTPEQLARIEQAAEIDEMSVSEWVRTVILRAAAVRTGRYE